MDTRSNDHIVRTHDGGFVLPVMVFALLMLGVMGAASLQTSRDELLSAAAVNSSNLAFYAAEAGIHDAVANWNAWAMDASLANPGDSLVTSWTTLENGCGYRVVYRRVDGGDLPADRLFSVESTGRSPGLNGATRRVGIMVKSFKWDLAAMALGGDVQLAGNPTIVGPCSDVHMNGDAVFSGNGTIDGEVSASGTVTVGGALVDAVGDTVSPGSGLPEMEIPDFDPMDYCSEADYIFENGWGTEVATGTLRNLNSTWWGWRYSNPNKYVTDNDAVMPGVYCMDGNVEISHELGSPGNPLPITLLTTGSLSLPGNPLVVAAHPDSILIMAEGDVNINGNPAAGAVSFEGLIYAGSQCVLPGAPVIHGQLVCRDDPNPPGSLELATEILINGDLQVTYSCGGLLGPQPPEPIDQRMWNHVW